MSNHEDIVIWITVVWSIRWDVHPSIPALLVAEVQWMETINRGGFRDDPTAMICPVSSYHAPDRFPVDSEHMMLIAFESF